MACALSFYITIGSIIAGVVGLIILHYTGTWGAIIEGLAWIRAAWTWFLETVPNFAKFLIFLFLLLFVFDFAVAGIIGLQFSCTSDNHLRQSSSFFGGVATAFECGLEQSGNISASEFDAYILENTVAASISTDDTDARSIMRINCLSQRPRLTFYNFDFLDYKAWILILLIGSLVKVYAWSKK